MYCNLMNEISKRDLTVKDFAKFINMSYQVFSLKLQGKKNFFYKVIIKIVEFFNCKLSADYLFEEFN